MAVYASSYSMLFSQPMPAADEKKPKAEPFGSMPPASMSSIMWRWPMKLIFSMPGVPIG